MGWNLGFPELVIIFVVALLVFGPRKLPELGKSLGKSLAEFKSGNKVRLCALTASSRELLQYLNSKKIALGTELKIHGKEDFDESMEVSYGKQKNVTLSKAVTESLLVESV